MESLPITVLTLLSVLLAARASDIDGTSTATSSQTSSDQSDGPHSAMDILINRTLEANNRTRFTVPRTFPRHLNLTNLARNSAFPNRTSTDNYSTDAIEAFLVESNPAEGDSITLSCLVYDPSIVTVSWYREDQRLTLHDILYPAADKHRMSISHDIADNTRRVFNLTIDFLHSGDSGEYTCRSYYRPDAVASVELTVTHNPELHIPECTLNGKRQVVVTDGDTLSLECRLQNTGSQWHSLWIRQHSKDFDVFTVPSTEGHSNMIESAYSEVATSDLNGATFVCSFVCFSSDCSSSSSESCSIGPLVVNPRSSTEPPPIIAIDPGIQIAVEGEDVEFSCSTSLSDSNAVWFPVGEEPPEDHIIVSDDGSQMAIRNVKENDTELMACGVFCEDRLITVGQVDLTVLHKDDPSIETTTSEMTTITTTTTTTIATTVDTTTISNKVNEITVGDSSKDDLGDTNRINTYSGHTSKQSVKIGIPIALIFIIALAIFLMVFITKKRGVYQLTSTHEPHSNPPV